MTVPTNTYAPTCIAGQFAGVVCKTDNAAVTYYMDSSGTYELEAADRARGNGAITETVAAHETGHAFGLLHGAQTSPGQDQCAEAMGIMRAAISCLPGPALGVVPKDNVNWNY